MAGEIKYQDVAKFGAQTLEFRVGVFNGFESERPGVPDRSIESIGIFQDITDLTQPRGQSFALTEGEDVEIFIGLFDPAREQFLDPVQIETLTTVNEVFAEYRITGFVNDSVYFPGTETDVTIDAVGQRTSVFLKAPIGDIPGVQTPSKTVVLVNEAFLEPETNSHDLIGDLAYGPNFFDFRTDARVGGNDFSLQGTDPTSIQIFTAFDDFDVSAGKVAPNNNASQEIQTISIQFEAFYRLNGDNTLYTGGSTGKFNYVDLAADGTTPTTPTDPTDPVGPIDLPNFLEGTPGPDVLAGTSGNDDVQGLGGADRITTFGGEDAIFAGGGGDTVRAGGGDDFANGGGGRDLLLGGGGDDTLFAGGGRDTVKGNGGGDLLSGDGGRDLVEGGGGRDQVYGDRGNDVVNGGGGADIVSGEGGNDTVTGGAGRDTFVFTGFRGKETVTDFNANQDRMSFVNGGDISDINAVQVGDNVRFKYVAETIILLDTTLSEFDAARKTFEDLI